jgi:c-di-GMP-binding flagellar brake protein YcgR
MERMLMNVHEIKIGTKLELDLIDSLVWKNSHTHISQLLDVLDENNIIIASPIRRSRFVHIPLNSSVRLIFFQPGYGLISCTGKITSIGAEGNLPELKVYLDSGFEKVQRRTHYRLDCNLDVKYRKASLKPEESKLKYKNAITRNISGSGVSITTEESIETDTRLELLISINPDTVVRTVCIVMRSGRTGEENGSKYEIGLHFVSISEKDRNTIIKFIFKQQILMLKNRKL